MPIEKLFDFMSKKRVNGQYFTTQNPFRNQAFIDWSRECDLTSSTILEPFAGRNDLIEMLKEMDLCSSFASFDIEPKNSQVQKRDSLLDFPKDYSVCITNPPYLAQNSAKRRGLFFPECDFDDLYKFSLEKCLQHCSFVGAIIPASFLNSGLFRSRLSHYVLLNGRMFEDTEHPVCLALFKPKASDVEIYENQNFVGKLSELAQKFPDCKKTHIIRFNEENGELGLFAIDNTINASIHFCEGKKIPSERIGISSRSITRISVNYGNLPKLIRNLNDYLQEFRRETSDIFLTPFKGLRKDGRYRRRLDYALARAVINKVIFDLA